MLDHRGDGAGDGIAVGAGKFECARAGDGAGDRDDFLAGGAAVVVVENIGGGRNRRVELRGTAARTQVHHDGSLDARDAHVAGGFVDAAARANAEGSGGKFRGRGRIEGKRGVFNGPSAGEPGKRAGAERKRVRGAGEPHGEDAGASDFVGKRVISGG